MKEHISKIAGEVSIERIIENIKSIRDQKITSLLKDDAFHEFLEVHFEILDLSAIRKEFLKRDLRELRDTSLDLVHYSFLIKQLKENRYLTVDESNPLMLDELKKIFGKVRG